MLTRRLCPAVMALASLLHTGCLDFEKQTILMVFPKGGKELHALLVYEGLHVRRSDDDRKPDKKRDEADLNDAKEDLAELVRGDSVIFFDRMFRAPLKPRKNEKLNEEEQRLLDLFKPRVTVHRGLFLTSMNGKFTYCQPITVRDPQAIVAGVNQLISESVLKAKDVKPDDEKKTRTPPLIDAQTQQVMRDAAKAGHAWLKLEPGRLTLNLPGTKTYFTRLKQQNLKPNELFQQEIETLVKAGNYKQALDRLQKSTRSLQLIMEFLTDTPWSVEQRHDRLTLALGWGNGEPLRVAAALRRIDMNAYDRSLFRYAETLGVPVKGDVSAAAILDEFERTMKLREAK